MSSAERLHDFRHQPVSGAHVRSGRLRALAVTGCPALARLPDLPTVAESGVPGYEASLLVRFVGPAGCPRKSCSGLNAEIAAGTRSPEVRERLASQRLRCAFQHRRRFARLLVSDLDRWAKSCSGWGLRAD